MKRRSFVSVVLYLAILALIFSLVLGIFGPKKDGLTYSQILELFYDEQVKTFRVEDQTITLTLHKEYKGKTELTCTLADPDALRSDLQELLKEQTQSGVLESYDFLPEKEFSPFELIVPLLIVGVVLLILWVILMSHANRGNQMSNFGRARTILGVPDGKKVTFQDVAGIDEVKEELQEVVDFLREPEKFTKIGARIPHGLLLVGPAVPARLCLPERLPAKQTCNSSAFPAPTLWNCM